MSAFNSQQDLKYGELVIIGYNGCLPRGDRRRMRSKIALTKRPIPNGTKLSRNCLKISPANKSSNNIHHVTYEMSKSTAVVAEYEADESTDMFQIGRSSESSIDFVVLNTSGSQETPESRSTVSRFACRILVDRQNPKIARIYAAAFNESKNLFLGENTPKWSNKFDQMDGLTTNGVLISHPQGQFYGGNCQYGYWREVSVGGEIYSRRDKRVSKIKGKLIETEDNILKDGTLIDLCGATLLWRSAEGLSKSPNKYDLEMLVRSLNGYTLYDDVNEKMSVLIPRKLPSNKNERKLYFYLSCGHVHYTKKSGLQKESSECSACGVSSIPALLCMGMETAFYTDYGPPMYAFNPCGHMASEKTIKFWARAPIPHGIDEFISMCPFCAAPLDGCPGYVELSFSSIKI